MGRVWLVDVGLRNDRARFEGGDETGFEGKVETGFEGRDKSIAEALVEGRDKSKCETGLVGWDKSVGEALGGTDKSHDSAWLDDERCMLDGRYAGVDGCKRASLPQLSHIMSPRW